MINEHILLERKKFAGFVRSTCSIEKAIKPVAFFCVMLVLLMGCGDPNLEDPKTREEVITKAIDEDNLQIRSTPSGEKLRYAPNQERPYAGWVKDENELYQFQNGKPNGLYISWFRNNQNYQKGIFRDGQKNGLWIVWYENGQKSEEGSYKDNIRDGAWVFWYENGQKDSEGSFIGGPKNGLWTEWYPDGTEESKGNYKEDSRDGLWIEWYPDGTEKSKGNYKSGSKDGAWTFFYEDGQKSSEGTYISGSKDGLWTEWYDNGTQKSKGNYKDDFPVEAWTWWYDNGKKEAEGTFKESKGRSYVYFDRNSEWDAGESSERILPKKPSYERVHPFLYYMYHFPGIWIKGIADGKWTFWHANGQKWAEGSYKAGNGVGSWAWWWPSGNKAAEGSFIDVKSDIYITDFGLSYSTGGAFHSSDHWITLVTLGGAAYGKWTFWQNSMPKRRNRQSRKLLQTTEKKKWFELTITEGYKVKNEKLWGYRRWHGETSGEAASTESLVDVRYETSSQQLE